MLDRISFLFSEAVMALRRNGWMTFAAVTTAAVSLFLVGGLGSGYFGLSTYANSISGKFEVRAYLKDGADKALISKTAEKVRGLAGVRSVNWVPRDQAWEKQQRELGMEFKDVPNPLPDAFKIMLTDVKEGPQVVEKLKKMPELQEVRYLEELQKTLSRTQVVIRNLGYTLVLLLLLTAGVLIFNAIRLTIISRRREIRIMQLVGAPYLMVRIPFLIEGGVQGLVGGVLGTLMLWPCFNYVSRDLKIAATTPDAVYPLWPMMAILTGIGLVYGLICSALAVVGPMKLERGNA